MRLAAWALAAPALLLCRPAPARAEPPIVSGIEIQGSSDPTALRYVTVKVGEPSDSEAIRSSVLLLSAMDLFDEVRVEQEEQSDGTIRLIFSLVEAPRLGQILFVTRPAETLIEVPLSAELAKALSQAAGLRIHEPIRDKPLHEAGGRMTDWLRAHAYKQATVEIGVQPGKFVPRPEPIRDLKVLVLQARQERLASSRIEGWPARLPPPRSPARRNEALTDETVRKWKDELLAILWKNTHYRAQIRTESVEGDLVFFVTPGPAFDLKLDNFNAKEQEKARSRFEQEGFSQDALEETMSTIEKDFVKRGYRDVEVDFNETPTGDRAQAEFAIRPGSALLLGAVEYQTDGVPSPRISGLSPGVPLTDADIAAERALLLAELLERGYEGASVSHEESVGSAGVKVTFKIVPGSLTKVRSVSIEGAPSAQNRGRESVIELRTRESLPFRRADLARDRTTLLSSLRDDGYVDARVEASTEFSDDRTSLAVTFHVTAGPRVRVGRILVVGLLATRSLVVLRESRLKEGDDLSYQKLLDTQGSLSATGLFTSVQVRELAAGEGDDVRNLIIEVTEGPRTTVVPGLGYAQTEALRGSVEFTRLNVSGRARTASLFVRGSVRGSKKALVSFTEPYAFGRRQAVNLQLYGDDDRSREAFEFHRLGFQTQTLFPLRLGSVLARYTFQKTTTANVAQDCAEINRTLCDGKISGPALGFVHDTRNDAIIPRRGTLYSLETQLSLAALGGDSFLRGSAFISRYEEVRAGTVIAGAARLGLSRAFGPSAELPLPERFFAGGASLMRGFKTDELGPGRLNSAGQFVPAGGNALVAAAIEARVDVTRSFGFQLFAETGNVFSQASSIRLQDLREVAGVGLAYRSPFGPLRLDWGFKLDRRAGEDRHQLHLAIGYAF